MLSSLCVVSSKQVIYSEKRFARKGMSCEALVAELDIALASRSSVPPGGELSSSERSRSCCRGGVCGVSCVIVDVVGSLLSTVTRLRGHNPDARHPATMLLDMIAFSRARMNISVHSTREMRPQSSQRAASVSKAKARFIADNALTSSD